MIAKKKKYKILFSILLVMVLSVISLRVTYAYFFTVGSSSNIQSITTGTLTVAISSSSYANSSLYPFATSALPTAANSSEDTTQPYGTVTISNTGSITSNYTITLSLNTPSGKTAASTAYLKIGVVDVSSSAWYNFGGSTYYRSLGSLTSSNTVPILSGSVAASATKTYRIYVWLDENIPDTEIGNYIYLTLNVNGTTPNGNI